MNYSNKLMVFSHSLVLLLLILILVTTECNTLLIEIYKNIKLHWQNHKSIFKQFITSRFEA